MSTHEFSSRERLLVLGAGELGSRVIRALSTSDRCRNDAEVSVLLRPSAIFSTDPAKQQEINDIRELGVSIEPGDIVGQSVAELAAIFAQHDTVVSCIGFGAGPGTQIKLASAALQADVKRYFPWQFGVDYDLIGRGSPQKLFDEQLDVRDMLRSQDRTEWVIISTGMFTSFLFEPAFGVVDLHGRQVNALGGWDRAVTVTTPDDIGLLTAEIVYQQPRLANDIVYVAGDTITYGELAGLVDEVLDIKVTRHVMTVDSLLADLHADPEDAMKKYRAVFAQGVGVAWNKDDTFNAHRGINTETVTAWARRNRATLAVQL